MLETVEKYPNDYGTKVKFLEDPYFFNEWYGFMFFKNGARKTFVCEKNLAGCVGYQVVNVKVGAKIERVEIEPEQQKIYILKRTLSSCKWIPSGKILPSPNETN